MEYMRFALGALCLGEALRLAGPSRELWTPRTEGITHDLKPANILVTGGDQAAGFRVGKGYSCAVSEQ
jgi:hypothetical protein